MIVVRIIIGNDEHDWFGGPCLMEALPPIGGTVRVIDKNANVRILKVRDVIVGAVRQQMLEEMPNTGKMSLWTKLICDESFG